MQGINSKPHVSTTRNEVISVLAILNDEGLLKEFLGLRASLELIGMLCSHSHPSASVQLSILWLC